MIFVAETSEGESIKYVDKKRYLWFLSVFSPAVPGICAAMLLAGGGLFWALAPLFFYYLIIPTLDMLIGEDMTNPPEEVVEELSNDQYYRALPAFIDTCFLRKFLFGSDCRWNPEFAIVGVFLPSRSVLVSPVVAG